MIFFYVFFSFAFEGGGQSQRAKNELSALVCNIMALSLVNANYVGLNETLDQKMTKMTLQDHKGHISNVKMIITCPL